MRIVRAGGDSNPLAGMPGGGNDQRFGIELYAQAFNALNHVNPQTFSGVLSSPFYGRAIETSAARRIEVGARATF